MKIIYDNVLIEELDFDVSVSDRALQYGDGIFESIIYDGQELRFFDRHVNRLLKGMRSLYLEIPEDFEIIKGKILELIKTNGHDKAKIRLQIWRKSGGLYLPSTNSVHLLIRSSDWEPKSHILQNIGFSKDVTLHYSKISRFKTCNSLPYILASMEREKRKLDELVICDTNGFISEGTSSNIFWCIAGVFYTPHIKTGCIEGIVRSVIIDTLRSKDIEVMEVKAKKKILKKADQIFFCNVSGVYPVARLKKNKYNVELDNLVLNSLTDSRIKNL